MWMLVLSPLFISWSKRPRLHRGALCLVVPLQYHLLFLSLSITATRLSQFDLSQDFHFLFRSMCKHWNTIKNSSTSPNTRSGCSWSGYERSDNVRAGTTWSQRSTHETVRSCWSTLFEFLVDFFPLSMVPLSNSKHWTSELYAVFNPDIR